jgi:thiamine-phosphate pyrophosphorylase
MAKHFSLDLYLVTDRALCGERSVESVVEEAVAGGVNIVQLREKHCSTREFIDLAGRIKALLAPYGVPLIINDRLDVALAVDADGLHVGQKDMAAATARRLLGRNKILGLSVESVLDVRAADLHLLDYISASPIYFTPTKTDCSRELGLAGLRLVRALTDLPLVAIGGLNAANIAPVIEAGADSVAVVSAICAAPDPQAAAADLAALIRDAKDART